MTAKMCLVEVHIIKRSEKIIKYLMMKRAEDEKYPGVWQMVTGHIEPNETSYEAAIRETYEETGANPNNLWSIPHVNSYYNPQTDSVCMIPVFLTEVEESFEPELSKEHEKYIWADNKEAVKLAAWPGQKKSIEIIEEYFTNKSSKLRFLRIL